MLEQEPARPGAAEPVQLDAAGDPARVGVDDVAERERALLVAGDLALDAHLVVTGPDDRDLKRVPQPSVAPSDDVHGRERIGATIGR